MQCRLIVVPSLSTDSDNDYQCGKAKQDAGGHAPDERAEVAANQKAAVTDNPEDNADDTDDEQCPAQVIIHD